MSTPTTPPSSTELKAEVVRTRADLAAAIDELTTRLSPGYQAARVAREAKQAASDAGAMFTGSFDENGPAHDPRRARNAKMLIGATVGLVALGTAIAVTVVLRRARG
ncbi:DUF3618 domain-containing protein [Promicromonospora thailandica]|uniref:DUF3618 domain-containing protein n=1 Tax=Promicromonospora thailandica TaxID=765201 RepID=A0A9X2JTI2_9MICO|nr:DUF3618 domain-containing protein [Promicromonospora thailandica]MCP2263460.1 Protein of unknown function (DUF3618) [Promicromonospora thailandica]BFF19369.1 hypothetical protein GCM10025730_28900 [Promicromonospora thailandica]